MIGDKLQAVRARIAAAAARAGRDPAAVRLLAVSKTQPAGPVEEAFRVGQGAFGENYVQEALEKMTALASLGIEWHLIGPLQSNKTRVVAERFHWVQSVDSERTARRLSDARPPTMPALDVLVQVNVSAEPTKSGAAPADVLALARSVAELPRLRLRGLMAIPEPTPDAVLQRSRFAQLRGMFEQLRSDGLPVDTLSMGMSDDMEAAIAEGSTMVRIGTAIFGARRTVKDGA